MGKKITGPVREPKKRRNGKNWHWGKRKESGQNLGRRRLKERRKGETKVGDGMPVPTGGGRIQREDSIKVGTRSVVRGRGGRRVEEAISTCQKNGKVRWEGKRRSRNKGQAKWDAAS